ncbi:M48 family metallopeptidase [Pseudomarimonas salicorniae]|uniref:M48 family metallopeptidase n=1 Tax=Pseudomarimonas salicorniae TaxID=2933270 RepID=A0ABT0GIQ2_9GAMM|nr:SprT family zinc-dependent metalloprotease [Lysobacter sp. CAU 1642]MCK7594421.1 M48 family metallopeptidase [Lysobacter sp. CAU 1642]
MRERAGPGADWRPLPLADGQSLAVRWVRDARARRLKLSINERGIRLTLPPRASERSAWAFLEAHAEWLQRQRRDLGVDPPPLRLAPDALDRLPLWGVELPLVWEEGRCCRLRQDGEQLVFSYTSRSTGERLAAMLRDFLEAEGRARIGALLPALLPGIPRPPTRFRLRPMSSLWGSLAPGGEVSLDLSLVLAEPACFDYVLVHEICHLIVPNHSPAFWHEVSQRYPGWRRVRTRLRQDGLALKARLNQLLAG